MSLIDKHISTLGGGMLQVLEALFWILNKSLWNVSLIIEVFFQR